MKVKTKELTGAALDWAVAKCEQLAWEDYDARLFADKETGPRPSEYIRDYEFNQEEYKPSTDFAKGGPIIEREMIVVQPHRIVGISADYRDIDKLDGWKARRCPSVYWMPISTLYGPTLLIAAMRCYVSKRLGEYVDIPQSLK